MKKSDKQLSHMAQMTANKIKDFHEDAYQNNRGNKLVDFNKLSDVVKDLERIANILSN